jgi:hypothetical protein
VLASSIRAASPICASTASRQKMSRVEGNDVNINRTELSSELKMQVKCTAIFFYEVAVVHFDIADENHPNNDHRP